MGPYNYNISTQAALPCINNKTIKCEKQYICIKYVFCCLLIFNSVIDLELYDNIIRVEKIKSFLITFHLFI